VSESAGQGERGTAPRAIILGPGEGYNIPGTDAMTLKATGEQTRGSIGFLEATSSPGYGPPRHIHHSHDEMFYVLEGEFLFLVGERRHVGRVVGAVTSDTAPVQRVMIFGGGRIGLTLALALEQVGISVKVIERDEARARYVASQLRKGLVLHEDGTSQDLLLQEGIDRMDAFVATTADDRANLLAAMYARRLGARQTIAGISGTEFAPLADALGVDITVSPRLLAIGAILRFVRRGDVVAVTLLESGAEMMEFRVPRGCRIAGRPLSEVGFPKGALVGAILRDDKVIIPSGSEAMKPGDDAVVFTLQEDVSKVGRLFAP